MTQQFSTAADVCARGILVKIPNTALHVLAVVRYRVYFLRYIIVSCVVHRKRCVYTYRGFRDTL